MPTMQRNPAGGVIDPRNMGRGAGIVRPPMPMPAFQGGGVIGPTIIGSPAFQEGGYVDDEGLEDQGYDDAMMDPMAMVSSALSYGKKKYGIEPSDQQGEMGFDDGGVVPTQDDQAQGNPNAIDPRQAMAYLAGDGAVSPEIAQALEQGVDPQGQLNPTQRAMAAIGVAPDDESRFGLLQHYRTKYNGFAGAAKAALSQGDMGEAAHQASLAMDSVPNGKRTQFAPAPGGLAMVERPAFGAGNAGQNRAAQPQQPAFDDGGEVEEEDLNPAVPVQEPLENPSPEIMPTQSVLPAQSVSQLLDAGFDNHIVPKPAIAAPAFQPQGPGSAYAQDQADAQRSAQLGGWGSAEEYAATQQRPNMFDPLANKIQGSLLPTPATPAPTTGSEAAARPPEPAAPVAAPATAPVTPPAQQGVVPEGAVIDEDRVNPFTGQVRRAAPGAFGSREAARRAGTTVPMDEAAARGLGSEDYSAARRLNGASPRGVMPTAGEEPPLGDATMRKVTKGSLGDSTGVVDVQTRPGSTPRDFLHRRGAPTTDPAELRLEAAQRQAAATYPWVGRDADRRAAETSAILKRGDEYDKAIGVEDVRAGRAHDTAMAAADRARETALATTQRAHDLEGQRQTGRMDLDAQKTRGKQQLEIYKASTKASLQGSSEAAKTIRAFAHDNPSLVGNPYEMRRLVKGSLDAFGARTDEQIIALSENLMEGMGIPVRGAGGGGGRTADYAEQAAKWGLRPEQVVPWTDANGKTWIYVMQDDGRPKLDVAKSEELSRGR